MLALQWPDREPFDGLGRKTQVGWALQENLGPRIFANVLLASVPCLLKRLDSFRTLCKRA